MTDSWMDARLLASMGFLVAICTGPGCSPDGDKGAPATAERGTVGNTGGEESPAAKSPEKPSGPLLLEIDPSVPLRGDIPDLTDVAAKRTPWDNFTQADQLKVNRTNLNPAKSLEKVWAEYKADPIKALLRNGEVDFQIVSSLYRSGVITFAKRTETVEAMKAYINKYEDNHILKANMVVALIHLGFDKEVLELIEEYKDAPWWKDHFDANFYSGTLLFRHRRHSDAEPFLRNALRLHSDSWTRLWLYLSMDDDGSKEAKEARAEVFEYGEHMQGGTVEDFPFEEASDKFGFRRWHLAGAVCFIDVDNDTHLDFIGNGVYASPELYKFIPGKGYLIQDDPTLKAIANVPSACIAADFDNDGYTDVYFPSAAWFGAGSNKLLKNDGGKGFVDMSDKSGAGLNDQNSCGVSTLDYNKDGLLDIAVTGIKGGSARLLRNDGDFMFTDVSKEAGFDIENKAVTIGLAVGDVTGNGYPDIFINSFGTNTLYMNQGDGTFKNEAVERSVAEGTVHGFGAWMFDYDNDGDMDIAATHWSTDGDEELMIVRGFQVEMPIRRWPPYQPSAIYKNDGTGNFENISAKTGFVSSNVMGAGFVDWDLDGDQDVILGPGGHTLLSLEPVFLYRNNGDDSFTNITPLSEALYYGKFHGTAAADMDRDGDPELYLNNGGVILADRFRDLILENKSEGKTWIHLGLEGTKSNRSAIGAKVAVTVGERTLYQEKIAGQGFSSTNSPYLIFGLDGAKSADKVEITWPSGKVQTLPALVANQAIVVTEGEDDLRRIY